MLTQFNSILTSILTVSAIAATTSTIATSTAIASDIQQGCESLGGTYHALENGNWMCLYRTPNHNGSLGVHCNQNRQCDRLVYSRRRDGTLALKWQSITPSERTDD
ncbi:hypothetical protein IFO70_35080 [Phormidium tenue FACHB-886]|nr:hypothetical protein [Phormidium tenue FACHB-886]